jgi:hypothetical protein
MRERADFLEWQLGRRRNRGGELASPAIIEETEMTVTALRTCAGVVEVLDDAIMRAAEREGLALLPSVMEQLRREAIATWLASPKI